MRLQVTVDQQCWFNIIFDALKKGDRIRITIEDGREWEAIVSTRKTCVTTGTSRLSLADPSTGKAFKPPFYLHRRDESGFFLSMGQMYLPLISIERSTK